MEGNIHDDSPRRSSSLITLSLPPLRGSAAPREPLPSSPFPLHPSPFTFHASCFSLPRGAAPANTPAPSAFAPQDRQPDGASLCKTASASLAGLSPPEISTQPCRANRRASGRRHCANRTLRLRAGSTDFPRGLMRPVRSLECGGEGAVTRSTIFERTHPPSRYPREQVSGLACGADSLRRKANSKIAPLASGAGRRQPPGSVAAASGIHNR